MRSDDATSLERPPHSFTVESRDIRMRRSAFRVQAQPFKLLKHALECRQPQFAASLRRPSPY
jgi:hypothetical protein